MANFTSKEKIGIFLKVLFIISFWLV